MADNEKEPSKSTPKLHRRDFLRLSGAAASAAGMNPTGVLRTLVEPAAAALTPAAQLSALLRGVMTTEQFHWLHYPTENIGDYWSDTGSFLDFSRPTALFEDGTGEGYLSSLTIKIDHMLKWYDTSNAACEELRKNPKLFETCQSLMNIGVFTPEEFKEFLRISGDPNEDYESMFDDSLYEEHPKFREAATYYYQRREQKLADLNLTEEDFEFLTTIYSHTFIASKKRKSGIINGCIIDQEQSQGDEDYGFPINVDISNALTIPAKEEMEKRFTRTIKEVLFHHLQPMKRFDGDLDHPDLWKKVARESINLIRTKLPEELQAPCVEAFSDRFKHTISCKGKKETQQHKKAREEIEAELKKAMGADAWVSSDDLVQELWYKQDAKFQEAIKEKRANETPKERG